MILSVENFTLSINKKKITQNWNFSISEKDFIIVTGKSGSGKTTLLNNLSLIDKQYTGNLFYFEKKVSKHDIQRLRRNHISYLFQNYALLENQTVQYNFELAKKFNSNISNDHIYNLLTDFSLPKDILKEKIFLLSGGEQQRIALIRNMLKPFDILFADEPTGNLDKENSTFIMNFLKNLTEKEKKAVVLVTHDLNVLNYGTNIIEL
ncbi:ABC transporter ATP-binding protein [Enterococcus faecium]|uniref:ABC superfamily ATP binding cassette transporter, ABC protein n=2 Tax=Enterococcus faecium TaxID=1352 RepID=Q3XXB1_ENTFD|nr:ABC transporter ATP-binding protein [Enterococcus faecium]AFK60380.1 ABC superfamily ATP binding cassette transporter, ABC protein [Enterococcus faecium DO]EAN08859.1 ABC transporter [Enterococcus faecium DO]TYR02183.1 ABC transporter [Enterococcus faecium]